jgi:hypothetical protein
VPERMQKIPRAAEVKSIVRWIIDIRKLEYARKAKLRFMANKI